MLAIALRRRRAMRMEPPLFESLLTNASEPFNLQEFLVRLDKDQTIPEDPEEFQYNPTLDLHQSRIQDAEAQIRNEFNKSSKEFFLGKSEDAGGKGDSRNKVGLGLEKSARKVSFKVDVNPKIPREFSPKSPVMSTSSLISIKDQPELSSPRPPPLGKKSSMTKSKVIPRSQTAVQLDDLHVYGGSMVYGLNSKAVNSFAKPRGYFLSNKNHFRKEVEMSGFQDEEIYFQTNDASIKVIGIRKQRDGLNARKVTEVVELPREMYPENLRISRARNGNLIVEQSNHT